MPSTLTYPGVYVEEIPSGVRTIVGVATSITAFVGRALRGPVNEATTINSFGDFERIFGGLWADSRLGFAVRDFYLNGGSQAIIVRLFHAPFATEADRTKVQAAAQAVADAATGADAPAAAGAARAKADTVTSEPEKTAANTVATKAETAALVEGASKESVQSAAKNAVAGTAPFAKAKLSASDIKLEAAYEGSWGANLRAQVDTSNIIDEKLFNLTVRNAAPSGAIERFLNLSVDEKSPRCIDKVLEAESKLVRWDGKRPLSPLPDVAKIHKAAKALAAAQEVKSPVEATIAPLQDALWALTQDSVTQAESRHARAKKALEQKQNQSTQSDADKAAIEAAKTAVKAAKTAVDDAKSALADAVSDGIALTVNDFLPDNDRQGLFALEQVYAREGLFNILCIPPYREDDNVDPNLVANAAAYCEKHRAILLVDPPSGWRNKATARNEFTDLDDKVGTRSKNAALFFPRLRQPNPLHDNQMEDFAPCGAVAGIFARTDTQRGVWKAPAGLDATLVGVPQLSVPLTDDENGELNPLGINCLRAMPAARARGMGRAHFAGQRSDWLPNGNTSPSAAQRCIIEESLYRGVKWVVFEPNDEPLWAQIRLNVGAFMHNLFRQGAFQGSTPRDAYFVKCDKETTTQNDINLGIVNIVVGFAPLKPAEFVIIKLQQMAGQIEV